jgi:hypothetical protein
MPVEPGLLGTFMRLTFPSEHLASAFGLKRPSMSAELLELL